MCERKFNQYFNENSPERFVFCFHLFNVAKVENPLEKVKEFSKKNSACRVFLRLIFVLPFLLGFKGVLFALWGCAELYG